MRLKITLPLSSPEELKERARVRDERDGFSRSPPVPLASKWFVSFAILEAILEGTLLTAKK